MCCFPAGLDRLLGLTHWMDLWLCWHSGQHKAASCGAPGGECVCICLVPFSFPRRYQPVRPTVAVYMPADFCVDLDRLSVNMLAYLPIGVGMTYGCLLMVQMDGELPQPLWPCQVDLWGTQSFMHSQDKLEGNKCLGNWLGDCSWLNQWQREHLCKLLHYNAYKHFQIMVVLTSKEH